MENTIIVYVSDHGEMNGEHGTNFKLINQSGHLLPNNIARPDHIFKDIACNLGFVKTVLGRAQKPNRSSFLSFLSA
jgi:arylsulfatase A-like enzyme